MVYELVIKNLYFDDINEWLLKIKSIKKYVLREFMYYICNINYIILLIVICNNLKRCNVIKNY